MSRLLEAHLKLLSLLPVRTIPAKKRGVWKEIKAPGRFPKPIEVDGVRYESVTTAHKERHCSAKTIYRLLDCGRARYI